MKTSTYERTLAAMAVAAAAFGSAAVWFYNPTEVHFFPVCPLYSMTGYACPGCGLTRGFHALFHGDISAAMHFNALIPIWAAIFGYLFISMIFLAVRGKGLPLWPTLPRFLSTFLVVLVVFGILRNVPIYPLTLLFP